MGIEQSYGIIPLMREEGEWRVLLIEHSSANYWGFPKGHAEAEEIPKEAATRELKEETNLDVIRFFSDMVVSESYHYIFRGEHMDKTVSYFIAEVKGELHLQEQEVSRAKWVPFDQAADYLTYETDRSAFNKAKAYLS